jgi:transcriptional regulator, MarR family
MAYEQLKLDNQICFRIYTASRLIQQAYEPYFKPLGITYTQYLVLLVLWENDEQPVNTIGQRLKLGINTTSPLIKRMEKLGLVARHDSEVDKRQQIVYLTDKGKAMKEQAAKIPRCMTGDLEKCGIDTHLLVSMIPALDNIIRTLSGVTATDADE